MEGHRWTQQRKENDKDKFNHSHTKWINSCPSLFLFFLPNLRTLPPLLLHFQNYPCDIKKKNPPSSNNITLNASSVENHIVKGSGDSSHQSAQELHLLSDHTLGPGCQRGRLITSGLKELRGKTRQCRNRTCVCTCLGARGLHTCLNSRLVAE